MAMTLCLQMTVGFARDQIERDLQDDRYPRWLVTSDGDVPPVEEMLAFLDDLQRRGYELVPCGHTVDARGKCSGAKPGEERP